MGSLKKKWWSVRQKPRRRFHVSPIFTFRYHYQPKLPQPSQRPQNTIATPFQATQLDKLSSPATKPLPAHSNSNTEGVTAPRATQTVHLAQQASAPPFITRASSKAQSAPTQGPLEDWLFPSGRPSSANFLTNGLFQGLEPEPAVRLGPVAKE